ncbi:hypothetical protein NYR17_06195 [Riemerella columbina]|nr:hypothetical protein [Riemerella columbina]WKS94528.1 hypothetical protein NYR17_06195 [Riemerella columbina]
MAFLSVSSIQKELSEGSLSLLNIADFSLKRKFYAVYPHGELGGLSEKCLHFLQNRIEESRER